MNIAVFKNNIVINTVVFDEITTAQEFLEMGAWADIGADMVIELPAGYEIGDRYIDNQWKKTPMPEPPESEPYVPAEPNIAELLKKIEEKTSDLQTAFDIIAEGVLGGD